MEINISFYGVCEIMREIVDYVKIFVIFIVKEIMIMFVRIIFNVSVIVIEMDIVINGNVKKKVYEVVFIFVIVRVILKESNIVSVIVIDCVIVIKIVNVMKKVKGFVLKKDIVIVKNEGKVMRLVIKGDMKKEMGRCGSV